MSDRAVAGAWHRLFVQALLKRGSCAFGASICLIAGMAAAGAQGQSTGTAPKLSGIGGPMAFERRTSPEEQYLFLDKDLTVPLMKSEAVLASPHSGARAVQLKVAQSGEIYVAANSDRVGSIHATRVFPIEKSQPEFPECSLTKLSADGSTEIYTVVFGGVSCEAMEIEPGLVHLAMGKSGNYLRTLREDSNGQPASLDLLKGAYDFSPGPAEQLRADDSGNLYAIVFYTPTGASNPIYELQKIDPDGKLFGRIPLITGANRRIGNAIDERVTGERVTGLDVDDDGNAYVVGVSRWNGAITPTANSFQATKPSNDADDGFLLRVNTAVSGAFDIDYATFLGGSGDDQAEAVAFDRDSQTVLIAGNTSSEDFPQTAGSPGYNHPSGFLTRLDLSGPPGSSQLVGSVLISSSHSTANLLTILPGGVPAISGTALDAPGVQSGLIPVDTVDPALKSGQLRPYLRTYSPDLTQTSSSTYLDTTPGAAFVDALASNGSRFLYVAVSTKDRTLGTPGAFEPAALGDYKLLVRAIDATSTLPPNSPPRISSKPSVKPNTVTKPTAITGVAFSTTLTMAVAVGSVDPQGADTRFAFAYGTSSTLSGAKMTSSVDIGTGIYAVNVNANFTGLTSGVRYYYRVQATNRLGTTNGAIRTFVADVKNPNVKKPTVTTQMAEEITDTTAGISGSVNPNGLDTHYFFAYGTSSTLSGAKRTTSEDLGSGTLTTGIALGISGLTASTKYYYRIQATNIVGEADGVIKSFTTTASTATKPTVTTGSVNFIVDTKAEISGSVNPNGADTHYVIVYGTSGTLSGAKKTASEDLGSGTLPIDILIDLTGLTEGTRYYFRIQATSKAGTTNGAIHTFATLKAIRPTVTTGAASSISKTTATIAGSVNPNGDDTHVLFAFGTSSTLSGASKTTSEDSGDSTHTAGIIVNLTGLTAGTKYYYRLQGTNSAGSTNGAINSFTTTAAPTVTTGASSSVAATTAIIAGSVNPNGADTHLLFAVGTSSTLSGASTTNTLDIGAGTSAIGFSTELTGLTASTKYYYQVRATNSDGTTNGAIDSFTTTALKPTVTTGAASSITSTAAIIAGSVNPDGSDTHFVFAYGTSSTLSGASTTASVDLGSGATAVGLSANLTGLTAGTKYYYQVQATNSGGTTDGAILSFTTSLAGWAGQVSCVKTVTGTSYSNNETQTWTVLPGMPQQPTGQTLYPTQWVSTGSGSTASQTWVINASGSGQITVFANGSGINFARYNSEIVFPDGYQATPPPSYTDYEYQWLPFGNSDPNATHVQGSSSTTSATCDSPVEPGGSSCTVACSWDFAKQ